MADPSAEGAVRRVGGHRLSTEKRLKEITASSTTPDRTQKPTASEKKANKSTQKHHITAPRKTKKKHFGKPFGKKETK